MILRQCKPLHIVLILLIAATCTGCTSFKRWLNEGFGRDGWQHPEEVLQALNLKEGQVVADLGSGSGYFTFLLAKGVGPSGKVYAVDVDPGMNDYVASRARQERYANIEVILAKPEDPLLPESGVDLIFTCITYHHLEDRVSYFKNASRYLRPGGRIAIIDFNGEGWFTRLIGHWTPREVILQELHKLTTRFSKNSHSFRTKCSCSSPIEEGKRSERP